MQRLRCTNKLTAFPLLRVQVVQPPGKDSIPHLLRICQGGQAIIDTCAMGFAPQGVGDEV
jgi:hypothetical protein